ncbi:hypothetical protein [Caulobacter sp.]|uniref:hypothetical protein n=1 Tax=Caulobacter sp. TaxID=78 RepID=UPI003BAD8B73
MTKTPDPESIAKAMRDAAWIATHGTREERSGKFIASKPVTDVSRPAKRSAAAQR